MFIAGTSNGSGAAWRQCWLPPVTSALLARDGATHRDRVATYLLPGLLEMDEGALASLLRALLPAPQIAASNEQVTPGLVSRVHLVNRYVGNAMMML
jgi:hypothetical protein